MMLAPVLTPQGLLMLAQSLEAEGEAPALEPDAAAAGAGVWTRPRPRTGALGADEVATASAGCCLIGGDSGRAT